MKTPFVDVSNYIFNKNIRTSIPEALKTIYEENKDTGNLSGRFFNIEISGEKMTAITDGVRLLALRGTSCEGAEGNAIIQDKVKEYLQELKNTNKASCYSLKELISWISNAPTIGKSCPDCSGYGEVICLHKDFSLCRNKNKSASYPCTGLKICPRCHANRFENKDNIASIHGLNFNLKLLGPLLKSATFPSVGGCFTFVKDDALVIIDSERVAVLMRMAYDVTATRMSFQEYTRISI